MLGAELKALYWMHGVPGAQHGFVKLNDASYVAFVQHAGDRRDRAGDRRHPRRQRRRRVARPGTMQHVAFNVDSLDDLLALRDRIRDRGVNVFGPLDHGMCHSIYFAGPENLSLEIATSAVPIDDRAWIDPEVVALCGIDDDELAAMRAPAAVRATRAARCRNPPIDPSKPHLRMGTPASYAKLMAMPDEVVTARLSQSDPPVAVPV